MFRPVAVRRSSGGMGFGRFRGVLFVALDVAQCAVVEIRAAPAFRRGEGAAVARAAMLIGRDDIQRVLEGTTVVV